MKKIFFKVKQFFGLDEHDIDEMYEAQEDRDQVKEDPVAKEQPKVEQQQQAKQVRQQTPLQVQHDERSQQEEVPKSKTFRFPLINDKESVQEQKTTTSKEQKKSAVFQDAREDDTLRLPKHLPSSAEVLDVEVSGIRQLLEKRGRTHNINKNVIRMEREQLPVRKKRNVTQEEAVFLTKNPSRHDMKEQQLDPAFVNPMQQKKRFTPTHVPSPVYGFQQPRPIRELMKEERNIDANIPVVIEAEEVVPTSERETLLVNNETDLSEIDVQQNGVEATIERADKHIEIDDTQQLITEEVVTAEQFDGQQPAMVNELEITEAVVQEEQTDIQKINELQLQNVTFENSTVHIGQIHVEPAPTVEKTIIKEVVKETPVKEKNISEEIKAHKPSQTGSKLPFNVLMLKSDKEKTQANPMQALKGGVPKTIVDKVEMRRDAQNGLKSAGIPLPKALQDDVDGDLATKPEVEKVKTQSTQLIDEQQLTNDDVTNENIQHAESFEMDDRQQANEQKNVSPEVQEVVQQLDEIEQKLLENYKSTQQQVAENLVQVESAVATLEKEEDVFDEFLQRAEDDFDEERFAAIQSEQQLVEEQLIMQQNEPSADEQLQETSVQEAVTPSNIVIKDEPLSDSIDIDEVLQMNQQLQSIVETVHPQQSEQSQPEVKRYEKPSYNFLVAPEQKLEDREWMEEQAEYLIEALQSHQIQAQVESIVQGPAVTQFEITVAAGTKVSKVRNLSDDIKLALAAKDIRIDAPIPGKRTIGIEIPNRIARAVRLSEVTESETFKQSDSPLEAALGLDLNGKPVTIDLRKMPHGLIAGATGSGKSVCINSILVSLLYKADPHELKLMLIDPKMVELAPFNHIPHLVSPVITDVKAATAALKWAVDEMERRYELFMHAGVRDITRYNSQAEKAGQHAQKMPYLLIVIDELADLMMMSPADVEEAICRIAQKARACGIHLIVATQRPSVDVITGLIKSNIPTRIAFAVSSAVDSRTILDGQGAERLLGRGDMLYLGNGMSAPVRLQGTFVTDDEIEEIIDYVRSQGEPNYLFQHDELLKKAEFVEEQDELFEEVCRYVFEQGSASTSAIQRRYHLGYNRAARLVDMLERNGFVSEQRGSKPREVFITEADLENLFS